jgi:hypothetical protein
MLESQYRHSLVTAKHATVARPVSRKITVSHSGCTSTAEHGVANLIVLWLQSMLEDGRDTHVIAH